MLGSLAVLALSACGSEAPSTGSRPGIGMSKASVVEDLPVPSGARLAFVNRFPQSPGLVAAQYTFPASQDQQEVVAWFDTALPPGRPWRSWTPCSPSDVKIKSAPSDLLARSWSRGTEVLGLTLSKNKGVLRVLLNRDPQGKDADAVLSCWT